METTLNHIKVKLRSFYTNFYAAHKPKRDNFLGKLCLFLFQRMEQLWNMNNTCSSLFSPFLICVSLGLARVKLRAFSHVENVAAPTLCLAHNLWKHFFGAFHYFKRLFSERNCSCISFIWIYMTDIWNILPYY